MVMPLPSGTMVHRVAQIIDLGPFTVANVHLSHGQLLNRRQLRRIAARLPHHAAVVGDYNLVGPVLLPGFRDVGPRRPTHRMSDVLPLRLDRCVVRGLDCEDAAVLPRGASDHRPITMRLSVADPQRYGSIRRTAASRSRVGSARASRSAWVRAAPRLRSISSAKRRCQVAARRPPCTARNSAGTSACPSCCCRSGTIRHPPP